MKTRDGFLAFVLDQLDGIENVVSRPMFGGVGLYAACRESAPWNGMATLHPVP